MELLLASLGISSVGALLALLTGRNENAGKIVGCTFGVVVAALATGLAARQSGRD